jgi:type I restriction enzyme R subunit
MLNSINPKEKTLVFCASIAHAGMVRDLINQESVNPPADYCVRVTAKDTKQVILILDSFRIMKKHYQQY